MGGFPIVPLFSLLLCLSATFVMSVLTARCPTGEGGKGGCKQRAEGWKGGEEGRRRGRRGRRRRRKGGKRRRRRKGRRGRKGGKRRKARRKARWERKRVRKTGGQEEGGGSFSFLDCFVRTAHCMLPVRCVILALLLAHLVNPVSAVDTVHAAAEAVAGVGVAAAGVAGVVAAAASAAALRARCVLLCMRGCK